MEGKENSYKIKEKCKYWIILKFLVVLFYLPCKTNNNFIFVQNKHHYNCTHETIALITSALKFELLESANCWKTFFKVCF